MKLYLGDSNAVLKTLEPNSIDSVVTDPPYGLAFMGKKWDYDVPSVELWREVLRVLKPGGHVLSFGGTRTYHRMVVNMEDAGFEVRDMVTWNYGSGFPKSTNVLKSAIKQGRACECQDRTDMQRVQQDISEMEMLGEAHQDADLQLQVQRGESRQALGDVRSHGKQSQNERELSQGGNEGCKESGMEGRSHLQAQQGELHRTEVCPLPGSVSLNVSQGRLRDGASIGDGHSFEPTADSNGSRSSSGPQHSKQSDSKPRTVSEQPGSQACGSCGKTRFDAGLGTALKPAQEPIVLARKPLVGTVAANVEKFGTGALNIDASRIGYQDQQDIDRARGRKGDYDKTGVLSGLETSVTLQSQMYKGETNNKGRWPANVLFDEEAAAVLDDQSGVLKTGGASRFFYVAKASKRERGESNIHPTVKPVKLMEYLVRMITPPGGTVLDPFMGSGTTGVAAERLNCEFAGIERDLEYFRIASTRIEGSRITNCDDDEQVEEQLSFENEAGA